MDKVEDDTKFILDMEPTLGMRDDPLQALYSYTGLNVYKKSILLKIFINFTQFLYFSMMIICLFSVFYLESSPIFMHVEYLPHLGVTIMGLVSNIFTIVVHERLSSLPIFVTKNCWCLESAGKETHSRILKSCKFIKFLHFVLSLFIFICMVLLSPFSENDMKWQAPFLIIELYCGSWKPILIATYYLIVVISSLTCVINMNLISYATNHVTFQYHILNHYVISLGRFSMKNSDMAGYQETIYKQIVILVQIHVRIKKFSSRLRYTLNFGVLAMPLTAVLLFLCVATFIIFKIHPESNVRMSMILVPVAILTIVFCSNGQRTVDESENVYNNALKFGWYSLNKKNRQALLIFLMNNMEPISFTTSGITNVDLGLLVTICKTGYTVLTLSLNLKESAKIG